jgi:hypothetical protein
MGEKASSLLSAYFRTEDVEADGPFTLTIKGYEKVAFDRDGKKEQKYAFDVVEDERQCLANKVNLRAFKNAWGDDLDDYIGHTFRLEYDPNVMFGTKRTGGMRVVPLD